MKIFNKHSFIHQNAAKAWRNETFAESQCMWQDVTEHRIYETYRCITKDKEQPKVVLITILFNHSKTKQTEPDFKVLGWSKESFEATEVKEG